MNVPYNNGKVQIGKYYQKPQYVEQDSDMLIIQGWLIGDNKKARIDKDVTIALYYNLLEAYFVLRNTTEADTILQTMGRMDLSNREKKDLEKFNELYINLKLRKAANGL